MNHSNRFTRMARRRAGTLVAAMSALCLMLGGTALSAAADAATLHVDRLTVLDTEDGGLTNFDKYDEVSMRYAGINWRASLGNGQSGYPPDVSFDNSLLIDVWELDTGNWLNPDDHIGNHWVYASESSLGQRTAELYYPGAHYELVYTIRP
jgi:hypothetical protein